MRGTLEVHAQPAIFGVFVSGRAASGVINQEDTMPSNNGWMRAFAAIAALMTLVSFISDLNRGRLNWRVP
jgi:hypothetical protein